MYDKIKWGKKSKVSWVGSCFPLVIPVELDLDLDAKNMTCLKRTCLTTESMVLAYQLTRGNHVPIFHRLNRNEQQLLPAQKKLATGNSTKTDQMLCLKPHPPIPFHRQPNSLIPFTRHTSPTALKMFLSWSSFSEQIAKHVVLFKVNPSAPPSSVTTMPASLNSLSTSIASVLHNSAAPILRTNSPYTHLLHSRFPSPVAFTDDIAHPNQSSSSMGQFARFVMAL